MHEKFYSNRLLASVSAMALEELQLDLEERRYGPGETLFREKSSGGELYLMVSGSVRISKAGRNNEQETLVIVGRDDFFGEMAILENRPRSAQACAIEEVEVGVLSGSEFSRLLESIPQVSVNFGQLTLQRLRRTSEHMIHQLLEAERLSLLGRMLSSIMHDFKNPMATILLGSHHLKKRNETEDPKAVRLGVLLEDSVNRMHEMIEELLGFAKGVSKITLQNTTVRELMIHLSEEVLMEIETGGIHVVRRFDYEGTLSVDAGKMIRLLSNLANNAAEAMPDGGTLEITTVLKGGEVLISFSDTGCGMPDGIAQRIFEPFFTHGKVHGTGLGMAIAKSVVDAHEGRIWLETELGRGTTFHIALPADAKPR